MSTNLTSKYRLRPYNPARKADKISLDEICEHVYGGSDYLPKMAEVYASDSSCSFLALTIPTDAAAAAAASTSTVAAAAFHSDDQVEDINEGIINSKERQETMTIDHDNRDDNTEDAVIQDRIIAVANYKRLPSQNSAWIEAVRTHPHYRNQGLATIILRAIVDVASKTEEENIMQQLLLRSEMAMNDCNKNNLPMTTRILTCTIQSNKSMIRALTKSGFKQCNTIPTLQFSTLRMLPGWKPNCPQGDKAEPLLHALDLTYLVSPIAKEAVSSFSSSSLSPWTVLSTEQQLIEYLQVCKKEGNCSGYLPGLYEYIIPGPNRHDLRTSLQSGLVLVLEYWDAATTNSTTATATTLGRAILALTQDERISSLKSKWVCSIVAYTRHAFEAALWMAHSDAIARRMMHLSSHGCCLNTTKENEDDEKKVEEVVAVAQPPPFCLVFDDAVPLEEGTLAHALPRVTDECIVFSFGETPVT